MYNLLQNILRVTGIQALPCRGQISSASVTVTITVTVTATVLELEA
jgi:hypothetical protein